MTGAADPSAPDVAIRTRPPSPRRLNRRILLSGALIIAAIVAFALVAGLGHRNGRDGATASPVASGPPATIQGASAQYNAGDLVDDSADAGKGDMLWGDHAPLDPAPLLPPDAPAWSRHPAEAPAGARPPTPDAAPDPETVAQGAPILFRNTETAHGPASTEVNVSGHSGPRAAFLTSQHGGGEVRLPERLTPPHSRYDLISGAVIPAALLTELNSDLPGRVIAQVTAPVYDSVSGDTLLIPQGAKLLGTYDGAATYGDRRLLLVWNRLIFPNGWAISLRGMEGSAPSGAAGIADRTDRHLDRLAGAIGLSAIISVIANGAEDDNADGSLQQNVGDAAAQEAARTGARIVERELGVRPTLRVRAGAQVRVLVTRDITLRPYRASDAGADVSTSRRSTLSRFAPDGPASDPAVRRWPP